jgi:hypothetical protein
MNYLWVACGMISAFICTSGFRDGGAEGLDHFMIGLLSLVMIILGPIGLFLVVLGKCFSSPL